MTTSYLLSSFFNKGLFGKIVLGWIHECSVLFDSFVTLWTIACQASLSMGFPSQEYCSGLPFPSPGNLPDPGIEPISPALAGGFFTPEPPGKPT